MGAEAKAQREQSGEGVRPRASKRKVRADSIEHKARPRSQLRSQQRFQTILDAAEALLETSNVEDISFHDIAARAGISPASVHYHFPSMAALRIELAKAHNERATARVIEIRRSHVAARDPRWQTWVRSLSESFRDYYNANRSVCEVLLGPDLHRDVRAYAMAYNEKAAHILLDGLRSVFVLPEIPGLIDKWIVTIEITETLWSRSYLKRGRITDEAFEEAHQLVVAYLRSLLPETLPLREVEQAA